MTFKTLLFTLICCLLAGHAALAVPPAVPVKKIPPGHLCEGYSPDIEVSPVYMHVAEDNSLRAIDLTSPDAWGPLMIDHINGITKFVVQNDYRQLSRGEEVCAILVKTSIVYRMESTLRINDPFRAGSCEAQQIALHKQKHIAAEKDFMDQSVPIIRNYLKDAMAGRAGLIVGNRKQEVAEAQLGQAMDTELAALSKYLNTEYRRVQQQGVDSAAEKHSLFAACTGWREPADER